MRPLTTTVLLAGAVACLHPAALTAQRMELTPFFASHYSLSPYMNEKMDIGNGVETVKEGTGNGAAFGARLMYWLKPTFGIEIEGVYSTADQVDQFPDRSASSGNALGYSYPANATMGSLRFAYRPRRSNLRLFAGVSNVAFGGDVYDVAAYNYTKKSTVGGVAGFGVRAQATRSLALDIGVEAYLHNLDRGDGPWPIALKSKFQQEVLVTVGVPIKLMN